MRVTLTVDENLLRKARILSGLTEDSTLIRHALKALVGRESARRLVRFGGSEPELRMVPNKKSGPFGPPALTIVFQ
jgi:Arc/MetJ family transcription regulator